MDPWVNVLTATKTGLWLIDLQEKLFPLIDKGEQIVKKISLAVEAAPYLGLPLFVTEQSPQALGETIRPVKQLLNEKQPIHVKSAFSGYYEADLCRAVDRMELDTWILMGIESHICVLQTAKDLLFAGKKVIVLADAISARKSQDQYMAIQEMARLPLRLTGTETVVYELVRQAGTSVFKALLPLVKKYA